MHLPLPLSILLLTIFVVPASAGSVNRGGACNQANNRLQAGTYQFYSDCDSVSYCASNSTCLPRGCRRDIFPFGYPSSIVLPPMCKPGTFCPDEMDACQPVLRVDSPCQLNRDDQCQAPPNFAELADRRNLGLNFNGSVCLNNRCMWANVTVGNQCVVENTAYVAYGASGQEFIDITSRGNCRLGLYCDAQQKICMTQKPHNAACSADKECLSFNCLSTGVCGKDAAAPNHVGAWVYVLVVLSFCAGMSGTLYGLFVLHRRQREHAREKRLQYWREQNTFLENIRQMRATAEASILSLPTQVQNDATLRSASTREFASDEGTQSTMQYQKNGVRWHGGDVEVKQLDDMAIVETHIRPDGRF